MNNVRKIRQALDLSQYELADAIEQSQGNISHYEQGRQDPPPSVAARLIAFAATRGLALTYDDIYAADQVVAA